MATTSGTLATGTAGDGGRRGNGAHHGRRTAGLLATAALGLGLLVGGLLQGRLVAPATAPAPTSAQPAATAGAPPSRDWLRYDGSHPGFVEYFPGAGPRTPPVPLCDPSGACLVP